MIIYKATNTINGKVYIGLTIRDIEVRKSQHLYEARKPNASLYFYRAINKYGEQSFSWDVIDTSESIEELSEKEEYWISHYNSFGAGGYNLTSGGSSGFKFSKESIGKISFAKSEWWEENRKEHRLSGSKIHGATLREEDVLEIRDLLLENRLSKVEISEYFNVTPSTIMSIAVGKSWRHLISEKDRTDIKNVKEIDVIKIKKLLIEGKSHKEIALTLGVSSGAINDIRQGKKWTSLISEEERKQMNKASRRMCDEDVLEIKKLLLETGMSQNKIAKKLNINKSTVSLIKSGKAWGYLITEEEIKLMKERKVDKKPPSVKLKNKRNKDAINEEIKVKVKQVIAKPIKKAEIFTLDEIIMIKKLLIEGTLSQKEIAYVYDVPVSLISRISTGTKWGDVFVPMWNEFVTGNKIRRNSKKQKSV